MWPRANNQQAVCAALPSRIRASSEASYLPPIRRRSRVSHLEMWDCPDELGDQTISRGQQHVRAIYLTFFGATTPKNMEPHLQNAAFWLGGLWSRHELTMRTRCRRCSGKPSKGLARCWGNRSGYWSCLQSQRSPGNYDRRQSDRSGRDLCTHRELCAITVYIGPWARIGRGRNTRMANMLVRHLAAVAPTTTTPKSTSATIMRRMLVGRVGIEPTTIGLKDRCSTAELPARRPVLYRFFEPVQTRGRMELGHAHPPN